MKKRQKPYVLIALLLVAGGAVAFMSAPAGSHASNPDETPQTGQDVKVDSKDEVANKVKQDLSKMPPKAAASGPRGPDGSPMQLPPAVLRRKSNYVKPKPNESSTSTQWYVKETPKELPKVQKADLGGQPVPITTKSGSRDD